MRKFTLFLALIATWANVAFAQGNAFNETIVFDFTNNAWGIPTMEESNYSGVKTANEYTDGTKTIKIDPTANSGNFYYGGDYLRIAKTGTKIILPAFGFAVEKIEVVGHPSATNYPNVDMNVYVGNNAVSTACIGSTATSTFDIAAESQAAGNVYELVIGSNGGSYSSIMYITYIKVYPAESQLEAPVIDLASGVYVGEQKVNVHSATADVEGVTDVTYYYTTDGNEPTVEDEETDGEIIISESCTLKVIVELTMDGSTYVSASTSAEYIITEEVTYHRATAVEEGSYFLVAKDNVATPISDKTLESKKTVVKDDDVTEAVYYALTLEKGDGGFHIKDVNGNYIYTSIMYNDRILYGTYPMGTWSIAISDDEKSTATISSNGLVLVFKDGEFIVAPVSSVPADASYPTLYGTLPTGINEVKGESSEVKAIYDLTGRKIETITKGGIYIINGKKVVVK